MGPSKRDTVESESEKTLRQWNDRERERERLQDAMLLTLKMEKGTRHTYAEKLFIVLFFIKIITETLS